MKNKIGIIVMSFIFLLVAKSYVFALENVDNEVWEVKEKIEEIEENQVPDEIQVEKLEENIQIKNEIENLEVKGFIETIGQSFIDCPSSQATFVKPAQSQIEIVGWAVSNDAQATVRILLDGTILGNCSRIKRGDVDVIISPAYGGVELTPNAGFCYTMDSNGIANGNHKITVQQLSRYGEIISISEVEIKIENQKYQGRMYIDFPNAQDIFVKPDDNKIEISGWAVSNDAQAMVRVLLDRKVLGNCSRSKRDDIDRLISPEYGGTILSPNAGFCYILDTHGVTPGNHIITVQELSRYGELITEREVQLQIQNRKYQGRMYIDSPNTQDIFIKPDDDKIEISGWAVSNDEQATIEISVDGNKLGNANRTLRQDVDILIAPEYGGKEKTPKAGFEFEMDITQILAGNHRITVQQVSRYGEMISILEVYVRVQNKQYQGTMYVEKPQQSTELVKQEVNMMEIQGWAVSDDRDARIRILLDGTVLENNCSRVQRDDVDRIISPQYGGVYNTPNAGFYKQIDITHLAIGMHVLRIEEISRFGDLIAVSERNIKTRNKQYLGEMCLDTPRNGTSIKVGSNLIVDGWAVAQDETASIEIYVDGNWRASAERYYRPDVVYFMNKYDGKTVNAGFGKLISTTGMSIGTHTVTVYEKSRYGDIIGGVGATFVVYTDVVVNPTNPSTNSNNNSLPNTAPVVNNTNVSGSKGIDVSQFQGAINWKSVAGSGIKYAMIRAGYRGYGNGGLAEDTKFKKNFGEAVANGLKVGVYFYSAAINSTEAKKDAEYVINLLRKYGYQNQVSMPIAIDLELVSGVNTRDKNLSKQVRTSIANTFCQTITSYGYTPMVYACKSFLNDNLYANQIPYDIWVAQYNSKCTYNGRYTIWQYTSSGKVSGINGNVDCNICYKSY